jgi:hypothetical protein
MVLFNCWRFITRYLVPVCVSGTQRPVCGNENYIFAVIEQDTLDYGEVTDRYRSPKDAE